LFSEGLRKSLFNYMHGICFDFPLQDWFGFKVPRTSVVPDFIQKAIDTEDFETPSPSVKIYWLGGTVSARYFSKKKKNQTFEMAELTFSNKKQDLVIQLKQEEGKWLFEQIPEVSVGSNKSITFAELTKSFEYQTGSDFVLFWNSTAIKNLRENGLLML
ncbi:MAG: radical SAM protein, partial [Bacteroidota bacterium]|nr:radical SAM protein [Bacteroidota bacterium]